MDSEGISIIICTHNGFLKLGPTLLSIVRQQTTFPFELIIVDNNSSDQTSEFVECYLKDQKIIWKLVNEEKPGLSFARWRGIVEAKFNVILFCDDDNHLFSNYLELGMNYILKYSDLGILGGMGIPKSEISFPEWFNQHSSSYAVGTLGKKNGIQPFGSYHYGAATFFRKSALTELHSKGFIPALNGRKGKSLTSGEDVELCYAIQSLGYQLYFHEGLRFTHVLSANRLTEPYYLKLKGGISSSFPILECYNFREYPNLRKFKSHLFHLQMNVIKGIVKVFFQGFENRSFDRKVKMTVLTTKFFAFFNNYSQSIAYYKRNKSIFNKT